MLVSKFLQNLSPTQYLSFIVVGPSILILPISWFFSSRRKPKIGLAIGIGFLLVLWMFVVYRVATGCMNNQYNECEWVGPGIVTYTVAALTNLFIYVSLTKGFSLLYQNAFEKNQPGIGIIVLLILFSIFTGYSARQSTGLIYKGFFIRWQNIVNPPTGSITSILDAQMMEVYVETTNGEILHASTFHCLDFFLSSEECWQNTPLKERFPSRVDSQCMVEFYIAEPPVEEIDRVEVLVCNRAGVQQTNYVLSEDGNLWVWRYKIDGDSWLFTRAIASVVGFIAGFIGGAKVYLKRAI